MEKEEYQVAIDNVINGVRRKTGIVVDRNDPLVEAVCLIIEQSKLIEQTRFNSIEDSVTDAVNQIDSSISKTKDEMKNVSEKIVLELHQEYKKALKETISKIAEEKEEKKGHENLREKPLHPPTALLWASVGLSTLSAIGVTLIFIFMP